MYNKLLFVAFVLFASACAPSAPVVTAIPTPTTPPEESAWYACTVGIERQYNLSILDAERYNPNGVILNDTLKDGTVVDFTTYTGPRQYEVHVYYAEVATKFHCIMIYDPDAKTFQITTLEVEWLKK